MSTTYRRTAGLAIVLAGAMPSAQASDLTIHLAGNGTFTRSTQKFQCDAKGQALGLPSGPFSVEYINGAGNSLAILPVGGASMIFANVSSGSGARYAAGSFIWWDASGRSVSFSSDSLSGQVTSVCQRAPAN